MPNLFIFLIPWGGGNLRLLVHHAARVGTFTRPAAPQGWRAFLLR